MIGSLEGAVVGSADPKGVQMTGTSVGPVPAGRAALR